MDEEEKSSKGRIEELEGIVVRLVYCGIVVEERKGSERSMWMEVRSMCRS